MMYNSDDTPVNTTMFDTSSYVIYAEKLPDSQAEIAALLVAVLLLVTVVACLTSNIRKLLAGDRKIIKLKGLCLVLLTAGQIMLATALIERSFAGQHNETKMYIGLVMWVAGRGASNGIDTARRKQGKNKRAKAKQNKT